jgi:hypothetical protein
VNRAPHPRVQSANLIQSSQTSQHEEWSAVMINRCVVIVRAREPFLQWLKSLPDPSDVSLEQANRDNTVYLLPEYGFDDEQEELIEQFFDIIFEEQLEGWWTDKSDWPSNRDLATFKKWFDVEFHSVVFDLVDAPIEDED